MVYYPLSTLMLAGIKDILNYINSRRYSKYKDLLGDGSSIGLKISYKVQPNPDGLAQAFLLENHLLKAMMYV